MAKSQSSISMLILSNKGTLLFSRKKCYKVMAFFIQNKTSIDCIKFKFFHEMT